MLEDIVEELLNGVPNSAAAIHRNQCRNTKNNNLINNTDENEKKLIKEILKLHFDKFTYDLPAVVLNDQEEKYYNKNIIISKEEAINLAVVTIGQQNLIEQSARQYRITVSHCYELYTYFYNKNPHWDKKIYKS